MKRFPSIKKPAEYRHVYDKGHSIAGKYIVMYVLRGDESVHQRLGISVSKRVGNSVIRHTLSRRIREIFRLNLSHTKAGCDIIIVVRNRAVSARYASLDAEYVRLLRDHSIYC